MKSQQTANKIVINHHAGTIDRHYVNGRIDIDIGSFSGKGARQVSFGGKSMLVHRLIYMDFQGPIAPWMQIDHIRGKEDGNGISNLRWTDGKGNSSNQRRAHKDSASGVLGVHFDKNCTKNPWRAHITANGRQKTLGFFKTSDAAYLAYLDAKRALHATCTI